MEGRFYRYKSTTHPHTNMAKAALNMMTRTSAADYEKAMIYMTALLLTTYYLLLTTTTYYYYLLLLSTTYY